MYPLPLKATEKHLFLCQFTIFCPFVWILHPFFFHLEYALASKSKLGKKKKKKKKERKTTPLIYSLANIKNQNKSKAMAIYLDTLLLHIFSSDILNIIFFKHNFSTVSLNIVFFNILTISVALLYHQKTENETYYDVLTEYKNVTLGSNGLT